MHRVLANCSRRAWKPFFCKKLSGASALTGSDILESEGILIGWISEMLDSRILCDREAVEAVIEAILALCDKRNPGSAAVSSSEAAATKAIKRLTYFDCLVCSARWDGDSKFRIGIYSLASRINYAPCILFLFNLSTFFTCNCRNMKYSMTAFPSGKAKFYF